MSKPDEEPDEPPNWDVVELLKRKPEPFPPFNGFRDEFNFTTCVLMQFSFATTLTILSILPAPLASFLSFITLLTLNRWLSLHGIKMTRKEVIFFEVSNLLEVDPPRFHFGMPVNEDCLTPGDGVQREPPQPQTLWDALFADEKKLRMDKFYREHYGGVFEKARRKMAEEKAMSSTSTTSPKEQKPTEPSKK